MSNELAEKTMSHEEMIETLKGLVFDTFDRTTSKEREALSRAIDLLSNSDDDCISRTKVLEGKVIHQSSDGVEIIDGYAVPVEYIEQLYPVTPKPKTGHWIRWYEEKEYDDIHLGHVISHIPHCKCSECDTEPVDIRYCPNCGAKMVEPQESEK